MSKKLFLVYNANGSIGGELKYLFKSIAAKLQSKESVCAACDITHSFRELGKKKEFTACQKRSSIPIECVHSNEQPILLKAFTSSLQLPVLILSIDGHLKTIFNASKLASFKGSVSEFESALQIEEIL